MALPSEVVKIVEQSTTEALSLMDCPVCLDRGGRPKRLICGHNVCQKCEPKLVNWNNQIKCPQCSFFTTRPPGGLVTDYQLVSIGTHLDETQRHLNQLLVNACHQCKQCNGYGLARDVVKCFDCQGQIFCIRCAFAGHRLHTAKFLSDIFKEEERSRPTIVNLPDKAVKYTFNVSFNREKQCAKFCSVGFGISTIFESSLAELPTQLKKLQQYHVTGIKLDLADFSPAAFSTVVQHLLQQPTLSSELDFIGLCRIRHPAFIPVIQTLLQRAGQQLRELWIQEFHPSVAPFVKDELILSAGASRLTDVRIRCWMPQGEVDPRPQCHVTDAIFDAIDARNFQYISLHYCPQLTMNGLNLFLQRWLRSGGQASLDVPSLRLDRCAQLTGLGVEQLCRRMSVTVSIGDTIAGFRHITITASRQLSMDIRDYSDS